MSSNLPPPIVLATSKNPAFPMRPDQDTPRASTGTRLFKVSPDRSGVSNFAQIDYPGMGVELVRGFSGFGQQATAGNFKPQITFLVGPEDSPSLNVLDPGNSEAMMVEEHRTYMGNEIYDGAVLAGRFDRLFVRWGGGASSIPHPVWLRIIEGDFGRVVYTKPGGPPAGSSQVIDYFDRLQTAIDETPVTIYDDTNPIAVVSDTGPAGVDTGWGEDLYTGTYHMQGTSFKRRLVAWFSCNQAFNIAIGTTESGGGSFRHIFVFPSRAKVFDGSTQHVVDLGYTDGGGVSSAGLLMPGCRLRIDAETQAVGPSTMHTNLSFMGA